MSTATYPYIRKIAASKKLTYLFFRSTGDSSYFYLYRISYMWYSPLGFLITFILGLFVSNLSRLFTKDQSDELDPNLFFPLIARRIRYRRRIEEELNDITSYTLNKEFNNLDFDKDNADHIGTRL